MFKVTFYNGKEVEITDQKATLIEMYRKTGMLTAWQEQWLDNVKEIVKIRDTPDEHTLNMTKDMVCRCPKCLSTSK